MEVIVLIWLFQEFYELTNEEFLICGKCLIHISCCFHESKLSLVPSLVISKGPKRNPGVGTTIKKKCHFIHVFLSIMGKQHECKV